MGGRVDKVMVRIDDEIFKRLQVEYFGDWPRYPSSSVSIPCGSKVLDNYEETSSTDGCRRIAGDGYLSAGDLLIHHIFKKGIIPARFRSQFDASAKRVLHYNDRLLVGLPFIEWFLKENGVVVTGRPKMLKCMNPRPLQRWERNQTFRSGRDPREMNCRKFPFINAVVYSAEDVSADNSAFRKFLEGDGIEGDGINAGKIFDVFILSLLKALPRGPDHHWPEPFFPGAEQD